MVDRTFVRLGWAILSFLVLGFLLLMVNQTADFVDLVSTGWSPEAGRITLWVLIGACLYFGIFTSVNAGFAEEAARALIGGGP